MRAEQGSPLLCKSAGPRSKGKRTRQLRRLKPLWSSPQQSNPLSHAHKGPEAIDLGAFIFAGDYHGQSIWSKTASAPSAAMTAGRPPIGVADKFLSIARIGAVTKEN